MDSLTVLFLLLWLAIGVLVWRFVFNTSGTKVGKVAHWFGGACVMAVIAMLLAVIFTFLSPKFAEMLNNFIVTHLINYHPAAAN